MALQHVRRLHITPRKGYPGGRHMAFPLLPLRSRACGPSPGASMTGARSGSRRAACQRRPARARRWPHWRGWGWAPGGAGWALAGCWEAPGGVGA